MKARELRIGNYIDTINRSHEVHLPNSHPLKVFDITPFDVSVYPIDENPATIKEMPEIRLSDVSAIPLTEKWLLKFGFISNPYQDRYELDLFYINCDKTKGKLEFWPGNITGKIIYIKSVHQLQNLYFALNGKELELKENL